MFLSLFAVYNLGIYVDSKFYDATCIIFRASLVEEQRPDNEPQRGRYSHQRRE
jgi:hypothetical protein